MAKTREPFPLRTGLWERSPGLDARLAPGSNLTGDVCGKSRLSVSGRISHELAREKHRPRRGGSREHRILRVFSVLALDPILGEALNLPLALWLNSPVFKNNHDSPASPSGYAAIVINYLTLPPRRINPVFFSFLNINWKVLISFFKKASILWQQEWHITNQ